MSPQSLSPSQIHRAGIQRPVLWHWNVFGGHVRAAFNIHNHIAYYTSSSFVRHCLQSILQLFFAFQTTKPKLPNKLISPVKSPLTTNKPGDDMRSFQTGSIRYSRVVGPQFCSSDMSPQSLSPSQIHRAGIQRPVLAHWNWSSRHAAQSHWMLSCARVKSNGVRCQIHDIPFQVSTLHLQMVTTTDGRTVESRTPV